MEDFHTLFKVAEYPSKLFKVITEKQINDWFAILASFMDTAKLLAIASNFTISELRKDTIYMLQTSPWVAVNNWAALHCDLSKMQYKIVDVELCKHKLSQYVEYDGKTLELCVGGQIYELSMIVGDKVQFKNVALAPFLIFAEIDCFVLDYYRGEVTVAIGDLKKLIKAGHELVFVRDYEIIKELKKIVSSPKN